MKNIGLFLFLISSQFAWATPSPRRTIEGPAELTEKAYNLTLQKDRTQAVNILVTAIRREAPGSTNSKELKSALQEVSGLFLGDKAQQLYELSLSLRKTDTNQAQGKLNEALRIEPDNLQLLNESARLQILKGDCSAAGESLAKWRKWNPYDEQTLLTSAQAAVCQSDWPAYAGFRSLADSRKGAFAKFWYSLEVEKSLKENSESRAKEALDLLHKEDASFFETAYWDFRTIKDPAQKMAAAQKYLTNCKNISAAQFRRSLMEPFFCRRTAEVESFVKVGL